MTDQPGQPSRYHIRTLLREGYQPFAKLDEEELRQMRQSMPKGKKISPTVPVILASDGRLLDGNQRLMLMLEEGREYISAADVRIEPRANSKNGLRWSVLLNVSRRQLTMEDKVTAARKLQTEYHMTQTQIAEAFGVTQGAISQWLSRPDLADVGPQPEYTVGKDGKHYPAWKRVPQETVDDQTKRWKPSGYIYKAISTARRLLQNEPLGPMTALERAPLEGLLADVIEAAEGKLVELSRQATERPGQVLHLTPKESDDTDSDEED